MSCSRRRTAYTLLEFLAIVAIIVVLIGLILPAIQRLRESSARTTCQDHLREIALGCLKHESARGHLPPGLIGPRLDPVTRIPYWPGSGTAENDAYAAPYVGVLAIILPQVDQAATYERLKRLCGPGLSFDVDAPPTARPWFEPPAGSYPPGAYAVANRVIRKYQCPSDAGIRPDYSPGMNFCSMGGTLCWHTGDEASAEVSLRFGWAEDYDGTQIFQYFGRSNYLGVAGTGTGTSWLKKYEGVMGNRSKISLTELSAADGASNTLLIGEQSGTVALGTATPMAEYNFIGGGCLSTYRGLATGPRAAWSQFSSWHNGYVQFAFADGSVRTLRVGQTARIENPEWFLLQQLAGYRDGEQVAPSTLE